jgi:hypothetical protein
MQVRVDLTPRIVCDDSRISGTIEDSIFVTTPEPLIWPDKVMLVTTPSFKTMVVTARGLNGLPSTWPIDRTLRQEFDVGVGTKQAENIEGEDAIAKMAERGRR